MYCKSAPDTFSVAPKFYLLFALLPCCGPFAAKLFLSWPSPRQLGRRPHSSAFPERPAVTPLFNVSSTVSLVSSFRLWNLNSLTVSHWAWSKDDRLYIWPMISLWHGILWHPMAFKLWYALSIQVVSKWQDESLKAANFTWWLCIGFWSVSMLRRWANLVTRSAESSNLDFKVNSVANSKFAHSYHLQ